MRTSLQKLSLFDLFLIKFLKTIKNYPTGNDHRGVAGAFCGIIACRNVCGYKIPCHYITTGNKQQFLYYVDIDLIYK